MNIAKECMKPAFVVCYCTVLLYGIIPTAGHAGTTIQAKPRHSLITRPAAAVAAIKTEDEIVISPPPLDKLKRLSLVAPIKTETERIDAVTNPAGQPIPPAQQEHPQF